MSGVELIIFGAGPALGFCISLVAWLHKGYTTLNSEHKQYHHDWI